MAGPTRLELATSCVTGRRSSQLNYDPARSWDTGDKPPAKTVEYSDVSGSCQRILKGCPVCPGG